ncbi:MAG: hypothetical protein ABI181_00540 [Mycobacteriaceae bacterium]
MNTQPTVSKTHQDYLARVRAALADLPAGEVDDILSDVAVQLEESDDPAEVQRLGSPEAYAAELRLAAGYPGEVAPTKGTSNLRARLAVWLLGLASVAAGLNGIYGAGRGGVVVGLVVLVGLPAGAGWLAARGQGGLRTLPEVEAARRGARQLAEATPPSVRDLVVSLRPAWWVLRAGLAAVLLLGVIRVSSSLAVALVLAVLLIAPSVWLARRAAGNRSWSWIAIPLNVLAVGVLLALPSVAREYAYASNGGYNDPAPAAETGLSVSNVYPFDANGRPLTDVYLYDQDGQPIKVWESTCTDGTYENTPGVDQQDPVNRFPLPHVVQDPRTGACTVKSGLPFSVAIPAGTAALTPAETTSSTPAPATSPTPTRSATPTTPTRPATPTPTPTPTSTR